MVVLIALKLQIWRAVHVVISRAILLTDSADRGPHPACSAWGEGAKQPAVRASHSLLSNDFACSTRWLARPEICLSDTVMHACSVL